MQTSTGRNVERNESSQDEFGASEGDARENDRRLPGFTDEHDRLFRSHFQHANRIADRGYDDVRPAYRLGYEAAGDARYADRDFDTVESDLENGWLSVRAGGDWQSVRDYAREGFERGRHMGIVKRVDAIGETASHQRPSFADPLAGGIDPTAPDSSEQSS